MMKSPKKTYFLDTGVILYELDYFEDYRGKNFEIYNPKSHEFGFPFQLDSCSVSTKGVLRGFHGDTVNWKLIQCLYGEIQMYIINMQEGPNFGAVNEFILNSDKPMQILIPSQVVNAHLCLSDKCVFYYKWSNGYVPVDKQIQVKWNDPRFNLNWKEKNPILSERDK